MLRTPPLQQIWLDHLLALSMLQATDGYDDGLFVFLYPAGNDRCEKVSAAYADCLTDTHTFQRLTLESTVAALHETCDAPWVEAFADRYLVD